MFKLNCILVSSVSNVCRQLTASMTGNRSSLAVGLQRTLCSSSAGVQEAEVSSSESESSSTTRHLSFLPPMPGEDSPLRWGGKRFEDLPIVHIKATYNNTHIQLTESSGQSLVRTSCGTEGFKNIKKSTPVAAQTAAISAAAKATAKGVTFVRVVVRGLGPGRMSSVQGLKMGGLQVVSITDDTPVPHNGCRPRKARRT